MMLSNCSASLLSADHSPRRKHLNCDVAPTGQPEDAGLWSGGSKLSSRLIRKPAEAPGEQMAARPIV